MHTGNIPVITKASCQPFIYAVMNENIVVVAVLASAIEA
jgi:hypothetical protein